MIKLEPEGPKGYIDRGWVFVLKGDLDNAGADFDTALTIKQNDPSALVGRGLVRAARASRPTAAADLALAKQIEPGIFDQIRTLGVQ